MFNLYETSLKRVPLEIRQFILGYVYIFWIKYSVHRGLCCKHNSQLSVKWSSPILNKLFRYTYQVIQITPSLWLISSSYQFYFPILFEYTFLLMSIGHILFKDLLVLAQITVVMPDLASLAVCSSCLAIQPEKSTSLTQQFLHFLVITEVFSPLPLESTIWPC